MNKVLPPMHISAQTRISTLIRANPGVIAAIASINKHFRKLENPLLRKVLASRVTIADAARIGGTEVSVFFDKLKDLGFVCEGEEGNTGTPVDSSKPALPPVGLRLDVREDLQNGRDPFQTIMQAAEQLPAGQSLLLINTFEPIPLFSVLGKKGFSHYTEKPQANLVLTYFYRTSTPGDTPAPAEAGPGNGFDEGRARFRDQLRELDVRHLEMPLPMVTILETLPTLGPGQALLVYHRRVPQYLLPQLEERGYAISWKETGPGEVQLLIYKN
ncbi:MAG: DUF2249 domain-containing protein [Adhaeribacter sp.]